MDKLSCLFGCLTLCGLRDRVARKLVFFPPAPHYSIREEKGKVFMYLETDNGSEDPVGYPEIKFAMVPSSSGSQIATIYITSPSADTTILFAHGNATDLGGMREHLRDICRRLNVNVFAYDYSGYGLSSGKACASNTYRDSDAVYEYLKQTYNPKHLILYGQSLGSGPTLYLAKQHVVSGVIIHSGIMSCLRVIKPVDTTPWFDIFPNIDVIRSCRAPVFVIHGAADVEVPIEHGIGLSENAPDPAQPWFVEGGLHNNIEGMFRFQYLRKIRDFLAMVKSRQPSTRELDVLPRSWGQSDSKTSSSDTDMRHAPYESNVKGEVEPLLEDSVSS